MESSKRKWKVVGRRQTHKCLALCCVTTTGEALGMVTTKKILNVFACLFVCFRVWLMLLNIAILRDKINLEGVTSWGCSALPAGPGSALCKCRLWNFHWEVRTWNTVAASKPRQLVNSREHSRILLDQVQGLGGKGSVSKIMCHSRAH